MEKNARVDVVGRNHEGKQIYKVTIEGVSKELYLVDAHTDCNPNTMEMVTEPHIHTHAQETGEPPLEGRLSNGLSAAWIDWYRTTHCKSLLEARDEGLYRLAQKRKNPRQ